MTASSPLPPFDEADAKKKLVELAKTSKVAQDVLHLVGVLEARVESVLLTSNDELTQAEHQLEDWRKMVTAIEELVQERITRAYTGGHTVIVELLEEVARDIAKTKADWS